ncbi:hypothetical protein HAX54_022022 [Datura stramonium]|uniref:Uncharacterized protein n=1 Tax=Datura stramonium TaxID=4076 RepID=A0ABS8UW21_DATST|nr:hypothetical protein [Datura stramonium]
MKRQGQTRDTIAERLKGSKESRSTSQMISEVLHKIKLENIAERVKASKPSRPLSSPITMEMVVECTECKKQINFLRGFRIVTTEEESVMCLSYEDAVDSDKCRKVNLVLRFLTISLNLIKSEGSLMDLIKHKASLKAEVIDLIESSHEELILLRAILMDLSQTDSNKLDDLLMHAEVNA